MARILVTGSSDGLGLMAARLLIEDGHAVTLHARNDTRADDAPRRTTGSAGRGRRSETAIDSIT